MAEQKLIKIEEHNGQQAVNARELHQALGSKQQFGNWIQNRIEKYGFVENQDYEVFNNSSKNPDGGRPTIEYALSIDMAKELAMVENNEKGRQIRQYFIAVERKAKQKRPLTQAELLLQSAQMLVDIEKEQKAQREALNLLQAEQERLREERKQATLNIMVTPYLSNQSMPQFTTEEVCRQNILKLVADYADVTNMAYKDIWHEIYRVLDIKLGKRIKSYKRLPTDKSLLDVAQRIGQLANIHTIISDMVRNYRSLHPIIKGE